MFHITVKEETEPTETATGSPETITRERFSARVETVDIAELAALIFPQDADKPRTTRRDKRVARGPRNAAQPEAAK